MANNAPFTENERLELLKIHSVLERLIVIWKAVEQLSKQESFICCSQCKTRFTKVTDIFTVGGADGTTATYVNNYGTIHQITTMRTIDEGKVVFEGRPSTHNRYVRRCVIHRYQLLWLSVSPHNRVHSFPPRREGSVVGMILWLHYLDDLLITHKNTFICFLNVYRSRPTAATFRVIVGISSTAGVVPLIWDGSFVWYQELVDPCRRRHHPLKAVIEEELMVTGRIDQSSFTVSWPQLLRPLSHNHQYTNIGSCSTVEELSHSHQYNNIGSCFTDEEPDTLVYGSDCKNELILLCHELTKAKIRP